MLRELFKRLFKREKWTLTAKKRTSFSVENILGTTNSERGLVVLFHSSKGRKKAEFIGVNVRNKINIEWAEDFIYNE